MRADRQDRMANLVTNYVACTGSDIGARYLFGAADLQEAARDHDYFDVPFTELLVRQRNKVINTEMQSTVLLELLLLTTLLECILRINL